MNYEIFRDFKSNGKKIENIRDKLPTEIKELQKKYGEGVFFNGFFKLLNSYDYLDLIDFSYFDAKKVVPFLMTAFGDIFVYEDDDYIIRLSYKDIDYQVVGKTMQWFWDDLLNPEYLNDYNLDTDINLYREAIKKYGELKYEECFGFVPVLPLGGKQDVEHLDKVNAKVHIELITQMIGKIE